MNKKLLSLSSALLCCAAAPAFAQTISTVAGNGTQATPIDGSVATAAPLQGPTAIAPIPGGGFYIGDVGGVRKVSAGGIITTVATVGQNDQIDGLALTSDGTLYFSEEAGSVVRKRAPNGTITTVAGTGASGSSGDGGPATSATLNDPTAIALDVAGNLYIVEYSGCRVRKVDAGGTISTLIGNGSCSSTGDNGPASSATVNVPWGIRVDRVSGEIFVVEHAGNRIRKIAANGTVTTFAGDGTNASTGDGGQATAASLSGPLNIDVDAAGNFYIAEFTGHKIRRVAPNGVITTVAGNGMTGASGDGGAAVNAAIGTPYTFATASGGYYIAQRDSRRVRFVTDATIQPQDPDPDPTMTCAEEGFTGTKLTWCKNICEKGLTGATLDMWIHRWINRYRDLPYCAQEGGGEEGPPPQEN